MSAEGKARRVATCAAALFLAVQLAIPMFVIGRNELSSRDFSWDMFSYQINCEDIEIGTRFEGEPWIRAPIERDFSGWAPFRRVLSEKRFRVYAQKLCRDREREHEHAGTVELRIGSACQLDRNAEPFAILDPAEDFCMTR